MTWSVWRITPFISGIFFVLGVFTLYVVLSEWVKTKVHQRKLSIDDHLVESIVGFFYMAIFVLSMQGVVVGGSFAWEFMNFQVIGLIFCAYFVKINFPYYFFVPLFILYMIINSSIGSWQSWCHAVTLMSLYWLMYWAQKHTQKSHYRFFYYIVIGVAFGGLLWLFMKLKFEFSWKVLSEQWLYLTIFEILLYSYVHMVFRDNYVRERLAETINHDPLTKALNYAAYESEMNYLFSTHQKNKLHLAMAMFDVDHFKQINDTFGHLAGDVVLKQVVNAVSIVLLENDERIKFYRTGGEEFNIIFPDYDLAAAKKVCDEIFQVLNHLEIKLKSNTIHISISMGISEIAIQDKKPTDFYNRVDKNLYYSKRHGRKQVTAK
ncbi:GGDEF domain-containing protein [Companilactobacillus halodurans]|uniref:GGDEF domain-containing protein n=1 Tax=Companilactobacillus halodurans TaxID=2584183 RepID=UPI001EE19774|nr:GGDEF domain-containing protein [Companilactobacillus halodurans]